MEMTVPRQFEHKSLQVLELRARYDVNLVVIRRALPHDDEGEQATEVPEVRTDTFVPKASEVLQPGDVLVLVGTHDALGRLPRE